MKTRRLSVAVVGLAALLGARSAGAEQSMLTSSLLCAQVGGLVACKVKMQSIGLSRITWATATIEQLPDFTTTKSGFARFKGESGGRPNLIFFLEPKRSGKGVLKVRLQASVCPEHGPLCESVNRVLETVVSARK